MSKIIKMRKTGHYFDPHLSEMSLDQLRRMVRGYGASKALKSKRANVDYILNVLNTPRTVRRLLATLEPYEQFVLALIKQRADVVGTSTGSRRRDDDEIDLDYDEVNLQIMLSGLQLPEDLSQSEPCKGIIERLEQRHLLLRESLRRRSGGYFSSYYARTTVVADQRILDEVTMPDIPPMIAGVADVAEIVASQAETPPPYTITTRMPSTVILELIGFLQLLDNMDGLGITQSGSIRVADLRTFQKGLQWPKGDDVAFDGVLFQYAVLGLLYAFESAAFVFREEKKLILIQPVKEFTAQSAVEQINTVMQGFLKTTDWEETYVYGWYTRNAYLKQFREILLMLLRSLPLDSDDFYALDTLEQTLFSRIGAKLSLQGEVYKRFRTHGKTPEEIAELEADWSAKNRKRWVERERVWFEAAFSSWLYYLGMVELVIVPQADKTNRIVAFRLTQLGKAVLHPDKEITIDSVMMDNSGTESGNIGEQTGAWIVQPNFDVIVYLDRATMPQLTFIQQYAERVQAQQYTAQYRLTRESVYHGLEQGTTLEQFLDELAEHAQAPLPQNVTVDIKEWSALRENITLHHRARLLEFETATARKAALKQGLSGTPVGKRFLMVGINATRDPAFVQTIELAGTTNYQGPPAKVVSIGKDGELVLRTDAPDMFITGELDQWAERKRGNRWQLTEASVTAGLKGKRRVKHLLAFLEERGVDDVPYLLEQAIRNWGGKSKPIEIEGVTLIRCSNRKLRDALMSHEQVKPFLYGRLDTRELDEYERGRYQNNTLIFASSDAAKVRKVLTWAGFDLTDIEIG